MSVFFPETEAGIFRQILRGKLDFESEPWPSISDSAKDLVRNMLCRDPTKRLSAHEVLCKSTSLLSLALAIEYICGSQDIFASYNGIASHICQVTLGLLMILWRLISLLILLFCQD
jgi:serine/threonine protein kinase